MSALEIDVVVSELARCAVAIRKLPLVPAILEPRVCEPCEVYGVNAIPGPKQSAVWVAPENVDEMVRQADNCAKTAREYRRALIRSTASTRRSAMAAYAKQHGKAAAARHFGVSSTVVAHHSSRAENEETDS
jgi:hypothetical protein